MLFLFRMTTEDFVLQMFLVIFTEILKFFKFEMTQIIWAKLEKFKENAIIHGSLRWNSTMRTLKRLQLQLRLNFCF